MDLQQDIAISAIDMYFKQTEFAFWYLLHSRQWFQIIQDIILYKLTCINKIRTCGFCPLRIFKDLRRSMPMLPCCKLILPFPKDIQTLLYRVMSLLISRYGNQDNGGYCSGLGQLQSKPTDLKDVPHGWGHLDQTNKSLVIYPQSLLSLHLDRLFCHSQGGIKLLQLYFRPSLPSLVSTVTLYASHYSKTI